MSSVFKTRLDASDVSVISKVLSEGDLGFGSNVGLLEESFRPFSRKNNNIATNSASASAFMLFAYLKDKYGVCDVYTTSLGFTSPCWSAIHLGHNLHFVDVNDDLQFSSKHYRSIRKNSSAKVVVMPVLYGGVSDIDNFNLFGDEIVIVDSAHCATPTIPSDFTFFSFHPYKPICSSDGGMISTNQEEAIDYLRSYRNFGRVATSDGYTVNQDGFKFYMNNLNATITLTQLKKYKERLKLRRNNFTSIGRKYTLLPHDSESSFYFATALVDDADEVISRKGWSRHYPMLHKMPYYSDSSTLPNLESIHSKILNIPLWRDDG
jgi:dTDP-4-amino-4,6-dideoxygalactose transaminase